MRRSSVLGWPRQGQITVAVSSIAWLLACEPSSGGGNDNTGTGTDTGTNQEAEGGDSATDPGDSGEDKTDSGDEGVGSSETGPTASGESADDGTDTEGSGDGAETESESESEETGTETATESESGETSETGESETGSDTESGEEDSSETTGDEGGTVIECMTAGLHPLVRMETTLGTMDIRLNGELVPGTVANFVQYVDEDFYDNVIFHRVIDGFVIQGGGYSSGGQMKTPRDSIPFEAHPDIRHIDGAISMASLDAASDTANSQFFICDGPQSFLDDKYAVFGVLTEGFDVLAAISAVELDDETPVEEVIMTSVYCIDG